MTSAVLERLYASGGDEVILYMVELSCPAWPDTIRIVQGFEDFTVTDENGRVVTFTAGGIDIALPARDTSGNQTLSFAIDNVTGEAQQHIDDAINNRQQITLTLRTYISTDLTAPSERPFTATVLTADISGATVKVGAGFFDMINYAWPRKLYTKTFAPGLTYLG